jgi:hypothetical protein
MLAKRRRGRPRGSRVDPIVRMIRQTGNPNFMGATIARAIIAFHQSRHEKENRLRAELEACKARGADPWAVIDALQMLDTFDAISRHPEERRVTHKQAIQIATEFLADGVTRPLITIESGGGGRQMVCSKPSPCPRRGWPNWSRVLELLRRGRA